MTLRKLWQMLTRWRWIVIPGVLVAMVGGVIMGVMSPVSYKVQSSYLFLSPVLGADGTAGNPFLQLGNGVSTTVDILAVSLSDVITTEHYTDNAPQLTYTTFRDTSLSAPLLAITVEDVSRTNAYATLDSLGKDLGVRLDALQESAGAPRNQWVTATQLTRDPKAVLNYAVPIRNGVGVALGLLLLTILVMALAERRRSHRVHPRDGNRPARGRRRDSTPDTEPTAGADRDTETASVPDLDEHDLVDDFILVPEPSEARRQR
ncbi:hypothetical protein [Cryobacterium arcticum]|uniref:Polysaccharide chain length determinant N-terminal domain-containing protein n=1 Tax=Cryobacterium arcticum TaxID=670052 RepID=A0A1B1BNI4_9MICO|nr:hypothetical protein [Cryobacterium arcticum]ANP74095.1 hypothetical protein PA27867_3165 [Cryobacterium arcticum]